MRKRKELSNSYLSELCTELSMLIQSGATPADALTMLRDEEDSRDGKDVLNSFLEAVENGGILSAAFRDSGCCPDYMVSMTEFGEKTGRVVEALEALSEYYGRQERLRVSLRNALVYPSVLAVMMALCMLILIIYVLPVFNDVFGLMGNQMPPFAMALMSFGRWVQGASAVIIAVICALALLVIAFWAVPGLRRWASETFGKLWSRGKLAAKVSASRFTSVMALCVKSGLGMEEAVKLASNVGGGGAADARNAACMEMIKSGKPLAEAMNSSGIISARDGRMLAIGSRSGRTEEAIAEIARRTDVSARDDIARLVGSVEPALVIITSVIVGVVLLSVMLPLIGIMRLIG